MTHGRLAQLIELLQQCSPEEIELGMFHRFGDAKRRKLSDGRVRVMYYEQGDKTAKPKIRKSRRKPTGAVRKHDHGL